VLTYHGRLDGSEPSLAGGSEGVVAADRVVAIVAVGVADEHAQSVIAISSAGMIVLN